MPWTARTFSKHNRKLKGHALDAAAKIATGLLAHGLSEQSAIRIANADGDRIMRKGTRKPKRKYG